MARKPAGMHPEDIRAALRKKFGTMAALSRHLDRHPNTISTVISQPGHSITMEKKICELLEMTPFEVFPERYHADGTPISTRLARTSTGLRDDILRRNGVAA